MSNVKRGATIPCAFQIDRCKDCTKRHLNCHSTCKEYKEARELCEKKREWLREKNEATISSKAYDKHIPTLIEKPKRRLR